MKLYHVTNNNASAVAITDIPVVEYVELYNDLKERMADSRYHVAHYFATEIERQVRLSFQNSRYQFCTAKLKTSVHTHYL